MADNLKDQISDELARIKGEIDAQKRLIKKSIGNQLIIETAEAELRALHTRFAVLEANMAKHTSS